MLFCAFVATAWAGPTDLPEITTDLNNPIYYTIVNTRSSQPGGFMYFAGESVGLKDEQVAGVKEKHMFYFTGSYDALYVHNAATNLKLASVGSWTAEGTAWAVGVSPKGGGLAFGPQGGLNGNSCWNEKNYFTDENTSDFTTWSANDDGSIFVVDLVEDYDINVDAFYTIECPLFEQVQGVKKGLVVDGEGNLGWNTVDLTNKNCYWIPTKVEGNAVALKNLGTGKFLSGTGLSDEAVDATVKVLGQAQYNIVSNGTTVHANNHGSGANASGNIVSWGGAANSASAWQFVEQQDPDAVKAIEITYEFTYKGEKLDQYTQIVNTVTGAEYPNVTASFPFGVSAAKPEGTIAMEDAPAKTVTIEVEVNLPFEPAADYASIKKWYYIQMHSSGGSYARYLQVMSDHIEWLDVTMNTSEVDTYTWAFVGNVFDGFKLVNYATGAEKGINSTGSDDPAMGDIETATLWQIKASRTNPDAQHFCFQYPGSNKYMNAQSGKVAFWTDNDQGSTMWVTERDLSGATELQAVIDQVEAFVAAGVTDGTTVGYITSESVANVATALTAAKEAVATKTGCIEAQTALQAAVAAVKTIQPEEGKFYTLQNSYTNHYMNVNNSAGLVATTAVGIGEVFQFVQVDGNLYLKNVERGTYLNTALAHAYGQNSAAAIETENAKAVTISNLGKANQVSITPNGGATLHHDTNNNNVVAWNAGVDSKSAWIIAEVDINSLAHTLNVTNAEWATLVLGYNAEIPEGVTVYAVSELNENAATLTEVKNTIPAGAAVLINAAEGAYVFNYTESADAIGANLLKGTTVDANIAENAYVLGVFEGEVGLYTATMNANEGAAFLNNAFKAYLPKTNNAAQTLRFNFGETTGIEGVIENTNANAVIFDLSGRRVAKMQKGIYIVNGKKVYVK